MGLLDEARQKQKVEASRPGLLAEARSKQTADVNQLQTAQPEEISQPAQQQATDPSMLQRIDNAILSTGPGRFLAELAAAGGKTVSETLDFFGPNTANAVLELAGLDIRAPSFAADTQIGKGGFMEPGVARDVTQAAGMLLPIAGGAAPVVGRNLATIKGAAEELAGLGSAKIVAPIKAAVSEPAKAVANTISDALPSKAKDAAKLPLYRQSGDVAAAGFKLDDAGRVVKDAVQKAAMKAGIDEGAVAMIASANKATKSRIKDMVDVIEKGRGNLEFRNFNTPQKVVGQAIKDRLQIIQTANSGAASKLDTVAKSLKNKPVDVAPAVNQFLDDLAGQGIKFNKTTGALDFADSTIEGLTEAQSIIKRVVNRLYNTKDPTIDAYRAHNAKKFIDEQVTYGKTQAGLSGTMEGIVKGLRHNLDSALDANFPVYDRINTIYSETRGVIDELQSLAGKKVNLLGENVDKALGVMSRKVLSNYSTGTATEDLFKQLDDISRRYSTPLTHAVDDELLKIVSAEAEIRKMFPTAIKPNTFQGEIGTEAGRAAASAVTGNKFDLLRQAKDMAGKVSSKSDEAKIQALKDLLTK